MPPDEPARARAIESEQAARFAEEQTIEERVNAACAVCEATVDKRVRQLLQETMEEYFADRIDEEELNRRKRAAREEASMAVRDALSTLEKAYGAYAAVTEVRKDAEVVLQTAVKGEMEAAGKVDDALKAIEMTW